MSRGKTLTYHQLVDGCELMFDEFCKPNDRKRFDISKIVACTGNERFVQYADNIGMVINANVIGDVYIGCTTIDHDQEFIRYKFLTMLRFLNWRFVQGNNDD